jgi:CHASE2 domain-containing sensor protein/tRNA A-37 threonylcarbamoyl transferase component Bud32
MFGLRLKKPTQQERQGAPKGIGDLKTISGQLRGRFSGLILYVLITILVLSLYAGKYGFLERTATGMQDGMFKFRGRLEATPAEIVVVGIDDQSVDNIARWPWNRDLLAQLVFLVSRGSPKAIGLDVFLPEQVDEDTSGRTGILADEIYASGNVILPIYFSLSDVGIASESAPAWITKSAIAGGKDSRKSGSRAILARQIYYPSPALAEAAHGFGHINIQYDDDQLVRRERLLIEYDGRLYPSFGLQVAGAYLDARPDQISFSEDNGLVLGKTSIPTDKGAQMLVDYRGPNSSFERVSALKLFNGEVNPRTFKNKVVLVGLTSTESKTWINIPAFGEINEVERIATVAENVIQRDFLTHLAAIWAILTLICIGVFCALILPNVSLTYRIVILLVFLFVVFNFSYILFSSFGILTKPVYPLLELALFLLASPAIKPKRSARETPEVIPSEAEEREFHPEPAAVSDDSRKEPVQAESQTSTPVAIEKPAEQAESDSDSYVRQPNLEQTGLRERTPSPTGPPESSAEQTMKFPETPSPGASIPTNATPLPLEKGSTVSQFGRYKIIEVLGKGGMGTVYKGLDPVLDRPVALKTLRLDFAFSHSEMSELKQRLMQEAKAAGKLSHPNIVTIYDVGEEAGLQYIAMEYLSGYTLEDFIQKRGVLNYRIVAKIIIQTCEALSYAHQHGIVHRDIKPANIMLLEDFHVKVMDFGIARLESTSLTKSNVAMGTPHYISPEQLEGKPADKRSDIFSLGVVIYELLTGQKPFQGENISSLMYRILNQEPVPPSSVDDKSPAIFDRVVSKAMAKNPDERYQNAEEITKVMQEFVSSFVVTRSIRI